MNHMISFMFRAILPLLLMLGMSASDFARAQDNDTISIGSITHPKIKEASGIASSRIQDELLWVLNDSGDSASIYAVNSSGQHMATVKIKGVKNKDWEDMASFEYQGKPYLLIADVGDNKAKRSKYAIHIIEEPMLTQLSSTKTLSLTPSWTIKFTYEDGPRDCESVAIDIANEKILLMSKRDKPPVLYELPLKSDKRATAKRLGEITVLPKQYFDYASLLPLLEFAGKPTSMDIATDGLSAVVLTYADAFYFSQDTQGSFMDLLSSAPQKIALPFMQQAEAISFSKDGRSIYVTSEKLPAPLYKLNIEAHLMQNH